jgi:anti-sigma-K factor RskA
MSNDDLPTPASAAGAPCAADLSPDQALALDFALGILIDPLLGEATRRCGEEAAFGQLVQGYRAMIAGFADTRIEEALVPPSPGAWAAIAARTGVDGQG